MLMVPYVLTYICGLHVRRTLVLVYVRRLFHHVDHDQRVDDNRLWQPQCSFSSIRASGEPSSWFRRAAGLPSGSDGASSFIPASGDLDGLRWEPIVSSSVIGAHDVSDGAVGVARLTQGRAREPHWRSSAEPSVLHWPSETPMLRGDDGVRAGSKWSEVKR